MLAAMCTHMRPHSGIRYTDSLMVSQMYWLKVYWAFSRLSVVSGSSRSLRIKITNYTSPSQNRGWSPLGSDAGSERCTASRAPLVKRATSAQRRAAGSRQLVVCLDSVFPSNRMPQALQVEPAAIGPAPRGPRETCRSKTNTHPSFFVQHHPHIAGVYISSRMVL